MKMENIQRRKEKIELSIKSLKRIQYQYLHYPAQLELSN